MTALFYSQVCDHCTGHVEEKTFFEGWIAFDLDHTFPRKEYVFFDSIHAKDWAAMRPTVYNPQTTLVKKVHSYYPFNWRNGIAATSHLVFCDTLQTIYLDSKYKPEPGRVHVIL